MAQRCNERTEFHFNVEIICHFITKCVLRRAKYRILSVTQHSTLYRIEIICKLIFSILYSNQHQSVHLITHIRMETVCHNWEDLIWSGLQTLLSEMFEIFLIWAHFISFPSSPDISRFPDFSISLHYKPHYNFGRIILQT